MPNNFPYAEHRLAAGAKFATPYDVEQLQQRVRTALEYFTAAAPLSSGLGLESVSLAYDAINLVEHKLGRAYRGFFVIRRRVPPCDFMAHMAGNQAGIVSGNATTLVLDTEDYDFGADYNSGNYRFTAPVDGLYQLSAGVLLQAAVNDTLALFKLYKNGTTDVCVQEAVLGGAGNNDIRLSLATTLHLAATNYVECSIYHASGVNKTVLADGNTYFRGSLVDIGVVEDDDWIVAGGDTSKWLPLRCSFDHTVSLWVF